MAVEAQNPFTGRIGAEYDMLSLMCPGAGALLQRLGAAISVWRESDRLRGLEIGCGDGRSTLALLEAHAGLDLVAIDSSPVMIEKAREKLRDKADRVTFVETDALAFLQSQKTASVDLIASSYAIHNFDAVYRLSVLREIHRALKPAGAFFNADRYALDDHQAHLALTQSEARNWFKLFGEMGRYDLLEDWIVHLFSDESAAHIMYFSQGVADLQKAGFNRVRSLYREGVDTLIVAEK